MLIIVWESNAIWTSSTTASRLRRQQIPPQIQRLYRRSIGRPVGGRGLEGNEEWTKRALQGL